MQVPIVSVRSCANRNTGEIAKALINYHYLANICFLYRNWFLNIKEKQVRKYCALWAICSTSLWKEQRLTVMLRKQVFLLIRDPGSKLTGCVYAECTKLLSKLQLLATHWSLRTWRRMLQGCPLCSQQDSRCPSKASGLVHAIASCLQAVCGLPSRWCMDGAWSVLLVWGLYTYRCICTVRLASLFLCVRLSLEAASILLNASHPRLGMMSGPQEMWPVCTLLRAGSFRAAWWFSLYPHDEALALLGLFWALWL